MTAPTLFYLGAALLLILIPFAPGMMRLRIKLLRWLRWNCLADFHQRHFKGIVLAARIIMLVFAVTLTIFGVTW